MIIREIRILTPMGKLSISRESNIQMSGLTTTGDINKLLVQTNLDVAEQEMLGHPV
jgi:hypothetical protein